MPKISQPKVEERDLGQLPTDRTDDACAALFYKLHHDLFCWVTEREKWYAYDTDRGQWTDVAASQKARGAVVAQARAWDVGRLQLAPDDKELARWLARKDDIRSTSGATAVVRMAETNPDFYASIQSFDCRPWELNTPSGVIDLSTGELMDHNPEWHHTKRTPFSVDNTPTPLWTKFLLRTFGGDLELIDYMQRLVGYSATGDVSVHVVPFLYGEGQNGKSVFMSIIRQVLGDDFCATLKKSILMDTRQGMGHMEAIARLKGKRLAVAAEVNADDKFDEARFKEMSGGDILTGNFMRENSFDFTPTHHMWMMGNHKPTVGSTGGKSFWRRLRLIPFDNIVPDAERDDYLVQKIIANEASGVLAWVVNGAQRFANEGLSTPARVTSFTDLYAESENIYQQFFEDRCAPREGAFIPASEMYRRFEDWCKDNGEVPSTNNKFAEEFDRLLGIKRLPEKARAWSTTGPIGKKKTAKGIVYDGVTASQYGV